MSAHPRLPPALVLALVALGACSGGDDTATSTTTTTSTTVVPVDVPEVDRRPAYFESLVGGPSAAGEQGPVAVPGSPAATFASHQAAVRALLGVAAERTLQVGDGRFEVCEVDRECTVYDAVLTDPGTGLVTTFSVGGVELAGRIAANGVIADRDGVVARVSTSYASVAGDLFVVIEVDNTTDVLLELFGFAAVLEPDTGEAVEASGAWGAQQLPARASGDVLVVFASAETSGQVRLSGLRGDGLDLALDLRLPTPDPSVE